MEHVRHIIPRRRSGGPPLSRNISWQGAAEEASAVARALVADPATLKQLRRVCQLLTSRTVRDDERQRAMLHLIRGCSKRQASAMLDYLIPVVRARTLEKRRGEAPNVPSNGSGVSIRLTGSRRSAAPG